MTSPPLRWIFVGAALFSLASLGLIGTLPMAGPTREWLTAFSTTLVSVGVAAGVGIWEFGRQSRINERNERDRLQATCAVETQMNVSVLSEPPAEILHSRTGETLAKVRLVHLPLQALDELARSGLEDPAVASELMWTVAHMRKQNGDVAALRGTQSGSITRVSIRAMTEDIGQRQQLIKGALEGLLGRLEEAGTVLPPMPDSDQKDEPFVTAEKARGWLRKG